MSKLKKYTYDGKGAFHLDKLPTNSRSDKVDKEKILQMTADNQAEIIALQDKLYADAREGLIILLQAMDAAGKDSTVRHVMSGINPQGVDVHSFKTPSKDELAHDFLWRVNKCIPAKGKIAIFNRSYYEDVLVVQVHDLKKTYALPDRIREQSSSDFFEQRYEHLRHYEDYLYANGYRIVKIFLNVSKEKQKERFLERIDKDEKNWKFSSSDLAEREHWDEYMDIYEKVIRHTASKEHPWYVIPADQKWYTHYLVSEAIVQTLRDMDPQYPTLPEEEEAKLAQCKALLMAEKD